jgi:membrane protease YdiL (CAAX protease family)
MIRARGIFWNRKQGRLRAGWRILIQLTLFVATLIGLAFLGKTLGDRPVWAAMVTGIYLLLGLGMAWFLARFIDHRPFAAFGFHLNPDWVLDFGFGLLLGAILMTGIYVIERLGGWISVTSTAVTASGLTPAPAILLSVLVYLVVAFNEEFAFRGYQLRNLAEGLEGPRLGPRGAIWCAWGISSAAFGLGHITNDNATLLSTINIVIGGLLLSLPFVLTGELAIPIGLHATWNLFQGTIFGFPVSGSVPTRRVLIPEQGGPALWTGGDFGPEGGFLGILSTLAGCVLVLLWIRWRRGRICLHESLARV